MVLTSEEAAYDRYVTVGRASREARAFETGCVVGILKDYLTDSNVGSYFYDYDDSSLNDLAEAACVEGYTQQRHEYTAEELFVWAWEFEREG